MRKGAMATTHFLVFVCFFFSSVAPSGRWDAVGAGCWGLHADGTFSGRSRRSVRRAVFTSTYILQYIIPCAKQRLDTSAAWAFDLDPYSISQSTSPSPTLTLYSRRICVPRWPSLENARYLSPTALLDENRCTKDDVLPVVAPLQSRANAMRKKIQSCPAGQFSLGCLDAPIAPRTLHPTSYKLYYRRPFCF
ncbi:hypothetical protein IscW_ISCW014633 [Ixodes scapularis]|uniref:Secreted protein n=1 Tax=Ixodes scapularis TaxID=6945 RepID=B7QH30_IXOSC|nr:hypothetical protein IscW_ISCW014633 [Ixodes scapularis]|eukprot:XP_002414487.1 hypothetical protein IscW_ISCW014633 [Ixodes scapularis]